MDNKERHEYNIIFTTTDPLGRNVSLYKNRWEHIIKRHGDDFNSPSEIKEVIEDPDIIASSAEKISSKQLYHRFNSSTHDYTTVVVDTDNTLPNPKVITAYKTDNKPRPKLIPPYYYVNETLIIKEEGDSNENK